jgi:hypothetical protein
MPATSGYASIEKVRAIYNNNKCNARHMKQYVLYWQFFHNNSYIGNVLSRRVNIFGGYHGDFCVSSNYHFCVSSNQGGIAARSCGRSSPPCHVCCSGNAIA